uniref:Uncharacterized protein n=1 Tax=Panagrolaimus superbus TaxID=310955 RepID=A0A914Z7Z1_9BILA
MTSKDEMLKLSISEYVYVSTIQPIKYTRLSSLFPSFFPYSTLEEACKKLGYYSFNDFIRQNHHLFDSFLTLFVCKDSGTKDITESPFILYYYNTAAKRNPKFISNFVENQPLDPLHVPITMEESIFFESHNSLDIVDVKTERIC